MSDINVSLDNELLKWIIKLGLVVAFPILMLLGIIAFPVMVCLLVSDWCNQNL